MFLCYSQHDLTVNVYDHFRKEMMVNIKSASTGEHAHPGLTARTPVCAQVQHVEDILRIHKHTYIILYNNSDFLVEHV